MRSVRALVLLSLVGCYDAHGLPLTAALGVSDAGIAADATRGHDAPPALACGLPAEVLAVPAGGCTSQTFPSTAGNACDRGEESLGRVVRVTRPPSGGEWYFLIRSRDPAATRIAMGRLDEDACACDFHASASGGDLTRSGVGGDLGTRADEVDLVLDGDERAIWLRICDGPPR